jgi:hypothetical protein
MTCDDQHLEPDVKCELSPEHILYDPHHEARKDYGGLGWATVEWTRWKSCISTHRTFDG